MPRSVPARAAAEEVPLCPKCITHEGLCHAHEPHVLPQLKEPGWYRDAHSGKYYETGKDQKLSPEGQRIADRKARKAAKRVAKPVARRLGRALRGEFTRSRPRRAVA